LQTIPPREAPIAVRYADQHAARAMLAQSGKIFGVIGYGAVRPDFLPASCPFVAAPLSPAAGEAMFEVWTAASPTRFCQAGPVIGACSGDLAFGVVTLDEAGNASLEDAVEAAYLNIFDFLDETGFPAPVRFWNYLTSITADDRGLQRYMRFNTGRHRAFTARLKQPVPPAASAVGGDHGESIIYFLAARAPARLIENPRQVSAYKYPPIYGPTSPSFSRAALHAQTLFISGTASIAGHETRYPGDLSSQIAETAVNLQALIGASGQTVADADWALKIYLRDPADRAAVDPAIDAMFGPTCQRLYLHGDICRSALLIEIEALGFYITGDDQTQPRHQDF
jgi:chorismate lyase/3-hydroxybenzoate synthase